MDQLLINSLNGISSGLLLFMLSSGLTLIFSMMGVLNFAHASFYMVGAYFAYTLTGIIGFWPSLVVSPILVGLLGALFERSALRRVHKFGHVPELLITFGLSYVILEVVQLIWGRSAVPFDPPAALQGPAVTFIQSPTGLVIAHGAAPAETCRAAGTLCSRFPLTRAFMMGVALLMLVSVWLLLTRTRIGLVIQASLTHPETVEALGHNVPRVFMLVFGGGCALAGLAGVIGGNAFVTEPGMAASVGPIIFVIVVVGGMGSLAGAFIASLLIGCMQTFAVSLEWSLAGIKISQVAPVLPYLLMVLLLIFRPKGLMGTREG